MTTSGKIKHLIFFLCLYFLSSTFALSKAISVDISYSGSDGLTKLLEKELRMHIAHSCDFMISSNQRSELQLLIAEDIKLKKIANHNQASYKVSFMSQQKIVSVSAGSCWQDQIYECADQILRDAKITIGQKP
jgi:hypothetical protein